MEESRNPPEEFDVERAVEECLENPELCRNYTPEQQRTMLLFVLEKMEANPPLDRDKYDVFVETLIQALGIAVIYDDAQPRLLDDPSVPTGLKTALKKMQEKNRPKNFDVEAGLDRLMAAVLSNRNKKN